ncbi:MAG TPA: GyrI-like domain-containing protein [Candidatus Limiplasma sp.]|nr:GyrI-like domain-containing protein [Candidatus Limiplasma sp.]
MAVMDFKKERRDLYQPSTAPAIVDVPEMLFLAADGQGDPNTDDTFQATLEALYALAYAIRMHKAENGYHAYVVAPLEGFWDLSITPSASGFSLDKGSFRWTIALRQPDFVTPAVLERARTVLAGKKPQCHTGHIRLERFCEGLCVQALHLGPYDAEPATLQSMKRYQEQRGFRLDYIGGRRHHELYLSRPNAAEPDKMKTILRLPIKRR